MERFAERYKAVAFAILALAAVLLAMLLLLPFVPAILWATVLTILTFPIYQRMVKRFSKIKLLRNGRAETLAAMLATLGTLVVILIPFLLIGVGLYAQVSDLAQQIERGKDGVSQPLSVDSVLKQVDASIKPIAASLGFQDFSASEYVRANSKEIMQSMRQPIGKAARSAGIAVLTIVIALLSMFFMLRDGERLRQPAYELIPLPRDKIDAIFARVNETVFAVFVGTVLVAIIQGAIIGVTYWLVGVPNALLLGVISVILCIIPLLGAPVLYIPAGLLLLATGNTAGAIAVLLVGFLIVSQIDNLLKPYFIGGRANLHPLATFFSILGGVLLFGPVGVMAGPMLLTLLLALQDIVRERVRLEAPREQAA